MSSGIATMGREIVLGTAMRYNWVIIGGAIAHPDQGKRMDLSADTNQQTGIPDSSVILYPTNGYGDADFIRAMMKFEKPDAIMIFTDPRYFTWLFAIEHEIRKKIPLIYYNIWDDLPYPMYNKPFYESCDALLAISKQTENINRVVLGDKAKDKVIKYVPHGIDENMFFPITEDKPEYLTLQEFKKQIFGDKQYDFVTLWNSRNIRRKSTPDILLAWKIFIDKLPEDKAKKCALILHTQPIDENGTDLYAVKEMLFDYNQSGKYNIIFSEQKRTPQEMNFLYNLSDVCILISSNEGWGLSLTEAMMCGKPIIAGVTGGMQDQMRFEDEEGNWIKFTEEFGSNHRGKYKDCGIWANPVFPSNISLIGSVPTPYIFDDRVDPHDAAQQIAKVYNTKLLYPEQYNEICQAAREWVTSDESMMTARWMCKNIIDGIDKTFEKWKPRNPYEIIKVEKQEHSKHYVKYPIAQ
ncbi:MAG TPA: glycosyltransferase [Nitrososphaeraceae archaeon]|nr:glycosyltransferase [Nitrososphaeraceae archaeon]